MKLKIEVIGVNNANLMDIINDETVYVIKGNYFDTTKFQMIPIKKADVGDLMSDSVQIVRITK